MNLKINENILKPEREKMSDNLMKLNNFDLPVAKIKKRNKGKQKDFQAQNVSVLAMLDCLEFKTFNFQCSLAPQL